MTVTVELSGLRVRGFHGVTPSEAEHGQDFLYDVWLELPEPEHDEIGETVDYRDVVALVQTISSSARYQLLESLAGAVADAIVAAVPASHVRVRVRKPEVVLGEGIDYTAATVARP